MRFLRPTAIALGMLLLVGCGNTASDEPPMAAEATEAPAEDGWTTLLDGSTLDGWDVVGDSNWTVGDGYVESASGGTGFLVSPESYGDFELRVEFWVNDLANSGIFIRCSDPADITAQNAYEVNIYDTRPDQTYRTGSIVDFAPPAEVINAGGQWNTFEIRAEGTQLTVVFNGVETVSVEDATYAEGPIGLQYGAGIVRFRNVEIREL